MSRDLNKMHPELRIMFESFMEKMFEANLPFMVTSVDRSIVEQMALYAQGRMSRDDVNIYRGGARLLLLTHDKENRKVTWTLNSKHVTNMFDEDLNNDLSRAFDIALKANNVPHWNLKIFVGGDKERSDYEEAGEIGESCGLRWGGRFRSPDYCHFEI